MMQGHTPNGSNRAVLITGFSASDPSAFTAFGHLIAQGLIPMIPIAEFPRNEANFRAEWARVFGSGQKPPPPQAPRIRRPAGIKHKATPDECDRLRELLRALNILV